MYKTASLKTGGSSGSFARVRSKVAVEYDAIDTELAQFLVSKQRDHKVRYIASLNNFDLVRLIIKLIDERYTLNKWLSNIAVDAKKRLDRDGSRVRIPNVARKAGETAIPEIIERWAKPKE